MNKKIVMPKKAKIAVGIIVSVVCLLNTYQAKAVTLESHSDGKTYTATFNNHFEAIRKMEAEGGTLGLTSTIDTTDWTDNTSNIDCHMAKSTEWGTVAILSISSYGAGTGTDAFGTKTTDISSTGNATGIYGLANGNWEYVAGCYNASTTNTTYIYNANAKYKDVYTSQASYLSTKGNGSALEFTGWLGASGAGWVYDSYPVFGRGSGGLFSFNAFSGNSRYCSRAVVVCGSGL
jgi:hypothetical protein